ncbi:hypothetical protein HW115_10265 [Verrucomicrobiaceae bacterium N1E253]|uniref:PA14 domain-containing protein n=1 Tax=Oceaniferula marina TaxID=2748318 RepID=A0A851GE05_9BACT|nr:PA14 domain-containing protein [Oceaniferula marina]NWK55998.1 hypothetical protein [Oceaniferula marina]
MKYLTLFVGLLISLGAGFAAPSFPPKIVNQSGAYPVSVGEDFAAYVVAEGDDLSYQWYLGTSPLPGQVTDTLLLQDVEVSNAGNYRVMVSNPLGQRESRPVSLKVDVPADLGVLAGEHKTVMVPNTMAYYDLYLPSGYGAADAVFPILFTYSPSGGGMVNHFKNVAEEKQWIVVGVSQSKNGQGYQGELFLFHSVYQHALAHLRYDPNRIFASGMSGGAWTAYNAAKENAPLIAGVFGMGGWLGDQYDPQRDIYVPGLLVARANGDSDAGANGRLYYDRNYMQRWLDTADIKDWSFPGGHVASPEWVQREVFDWFLSRTIPSTADERAQAKGKKAEWMARITAGETNLVFEELVSQQFDHPRNPLAVAAWQANDYLFSRYDLFSRKEPPSFSAFDRADHLSAHLLYALYCYIQWDDPSRQHSARLATMALDDIWDATMWNNDMCLVQGVPPTAFDRYVLDQGLYNRPGKPLFGDWDADGVYNFSEYVFGSDPLTPDCRPIVETEVRGDDLYVVLPDLRTLAGARMYCISNEEPVAEFWDIANSDTWSNLLPSGRSEFFYRKKDAVMEGQHFVRIGATVHSGWMDYNGDGIPLDLDVKTPGFSYFPFEYSSSPDSREYTLVPGGAPRYLIYLTSASIFQNSGMTEYSLRYHPLLAGYNGYLYHEVWTGVSGSSLAGARSVMDQKPPNGRRLMTTSQAVWFGGERYDYLGSNYLERTRGYIVPSESGEHTFAISGDDQCELWLSSDEQPFNAEKIAFVAGWTGYQNFSSSGDQTSTSLQLEAGKAYYVEILHKEGGGDGHCAVAWKTPSITDFTIIGAEHLRCLPASYIEPEHQWFKEVWTEVSGTDITSLQNVILAGTEPSYTSSMSVSEIPTNIGSNYGVRIRGKIIAPETADYTFWIASDDMSDLYLSTDSGVANKQRIAYVNGWTSERAYDANPSQKSATIRLQQGEEYYVEILYKEGGGDDHLSVAWKYNGQPRQPITAEHMKGFSE